MAFLSPLFLVGAFAVAIPIAVHLLKRHPEARVKFSAVHLLRMAPVEHASRRRLRELLLLTLRVAALLLLALAFARPFLVSGSAVAAPGTTIVVLDTSLSMSAPGQFERARARADQAIADAPAGELVGVVTFADRAQVVSPPSIDRARAKAAVDAAAPGAGGTRYRAGLNTAGHLLRTERGTLVVVTDLQTSGWDARAEMDVPESTRIVVQDVGAMPANLAVTALSVSGERLVGSVRNAGPAARDARLRVSAGNGDAVAASTSAGEATVSVAAQQTADFALPLPRARWASVSVADEAGIQADNTRYVVLGSDVRPTVLIVTSTGDLEREAFYVQQALIAAGADGSAYRAEGVAGSALQSWDQARLDAHVAIVLLSTRGLEHHGRELIATYVRRGGGVLVAASGDVDGEVVSEALGGAKVAIAPPTDSPSASGASRALAPADMRHPVLRSFGDTSPLSLVKFTRVIGIRGENCETLARFTTGESALIDCEAAAGRALILASDLDNKGNDFPRHATFLPFLHEALRYLSRTTPASEYLVADVPAVVPPVPGVAQMAQEDSLPARLVAVNVDPAESDPGRLTAAEFQTTITRSKSVPISTTRSDNEDQEDRQHLWQYLLALMVATLIAESVLAAKTA